MDSRLVQCIPKEEVKHLEEEEIEIEQEEEEQVMEEDEDDCHHEVLQKAAEVLYSGSEMIDSPAAGEMEEEDAVSEALEEEDDKLGEEKAEEEIVDILEDEEDDGETEEPMNEADPEIQVLTKDSDRMDKQEDLIAQNQQIPQRYSNVVSDSRRFIQEK